MEGELLLDHLESRELVVGSLAERDFERLSKWILETEPLYKSVVEKVWLWDDWPDKWGRDTGIDIVITVCDDASQLCPTFPGVIEHIHWSVDDPFVNWSDEEHLLPPYRQIRDTLKVRIQDFLGSRD